MLSWKQFIESDPFVARWLEGRPVSTQKHWSPYVRAFCEFAGVNPAEFVKLDIKAARRLVWRFVEPISRRFPSKAIGVRVALQSLYRYGTEGDVLTFDSRRGGAHFIKYVRNGNGYIPKSSEVYRVADCAGSLKGTAVVLVLFQSGIRPNALCGLNYWHVREQLEKEYMKANFGRHTAKREVTVLREQIERYEDGMKVLRLLSDPEVAPKFEAWIERLKK